MINLSVVIPIYQSADCLEELYRRLLKVLAKISPRYEIVFVEDGGRDNSWELLKGFVRNNPRVKAIRLSRNFGQHTAIMTGLSHCSGKWAVVMDGDLQDPPEEITRLWKKAQEGFDIVFSKRLEAKRSFWRKGLSILYFRAINFINQSSFDREIENFSIISRQVIDAYLRVRDNTLHYLFSLYWLGFKSTLVGYEKRIRLKGKSTYNVRKLIQHALNGLFFQTAFLLQWIIGLGFGLSVCGLLFAFYIVCRFLFQSVLPGWSSLVVLILMVGGFIILSTGVTGLYIGKIFEQVRGRPLFVFQSQIVNRRESHPEIKTILGRKGA